MAYHFSMRHLFICFLLCLMPLRLWAGVWMPMAQGAAHHPQTGVSANPTPHAGAAHDCHGAQVVGVAGHEAHGTHAMTDAQALSAVPQASEALVDVAQGLEAGGDAAAVDVAQATADCHDGTCQLCGVCHQSASLTAMPLVLPVFPTHALPAGGPQPPAAGVSVPLIKPPIS